MQENKKYSKDGKRIFTPATPEDGEFQVLFHEQIVGISKENKLETLDGNSTRRANPLSSELEEGMSIATTNGKPKNLKEDIEERE